jgi:hypothetical protein
LQPTTHLLRRIVTNQGDLGPEPISAAELNALLVGDPHRREMPDELQIIGQQALLNLVLNPEGCEITLWIDGKPHDYADALRQNKDRINTEYDRFIDALRRGAFE